MKIAAVCTLHATEGVTMTRLGIITGVVLTSVLGLIGVCASAALAADPPTPPHQDLEQAISDQAQRTTIGFSGVAMITGNLDAQSFFPPGKLVDYWGFQYLRDNDPSSMGHNTSFLTRVACNVLFTLDTAQIAKLKALATSQVGQINEYGYERYPLMKAFRRLLEGDLPAGATGLDLAAVKAASSDLYVLDAQMSYDRAVVYADIFRSLSASQKAYLDAMVGKGWSAWPDKDMEDVRDKTAGLSRDESVAVMTYAGDLYSWYAGNVDADVYFCPERHGTYYGGFYIKDAPAIGHEGYSINEQLTATAGTCLCDSSKGYVTAAQAQLVSALVDTQRDNLHSGASNIVQARTDISEALRSLITATPPTAAFLAQVKATVLARSGEYGELDGENNYHYATAFAQLRASLSAAQLTKLAELRHSIMSGTYADGTPFDFTTCTTPFLFSAAIADPSVLDPYVSDTDYLFAVAATPEAAFSCLPALPLAGIAVQFSDASTGVLTSWAWDFGDGSTSTLQSPSHTYAAPGTYTVTLTVTGTAGSDAASTTLTVAPACTVTGVALTSSPFGLRIKGAGFHSGCKAWIDGRSAPTTIRRSASLLLARGSGLVARLPKGVAVRIVVRNPDGGRSAPFVFTR
jgi:hypothetical protein